MKQVGVALEKAWRHSDTRHPTKAQHLVVIMNGAPKENSRKESKGKSRPGHEDPENDVIFLDNPVFKVSDIVPHGHQLSILFQCTKYKIYFIMHYKIILRSSHVLRMTDIQYFETLPKYVKNKNGPHLYAT